jgi:hypothetical protein
MVFLGEISSYGQNTSGVPSCLYNINFLDFSINSNFLYN